MFLDVVPERWGVDIITDREHVYGKFHRKYGVAREELRVASRKVLICTTKTVEVHGFAKKGSLQEVCWDLGKVVGKHGNCGDN